MSPIEQHAYCLGISPTSTAAAWSFLRGNPLHVQGGSGDQIGAVELHDATTWMDRALSNYAQGMEWLRSQPVEVTSRYIEDLRVLGLRAVQAIGEIFELAVLMGARTWVQAVAILRVAVIDSIKALAKGANEALRAFWGIPPIVGPIVAGTALAVGLAVGLGVLVYIATGPTGMTLAKGAAKGLSRGLPGF